MSDTATTLISLLTFLASTAGAGWAASALFARVRAAVPCPTREAWPTLGPARRLLAVALYAPAWARVTVFALSAAISLAATAGAALLAGQDARPALDAALAVIVSQLVHAAGLPATPEPAP